MLISDEGCLLRKAVSGEKHLLLVLFLRGNGLRMTLARQQSRAGSAVSLPDLFETGDFRLEQKDGGPSFLRDYSRGHGFPELARGYRPLWAASQLALFYERNLLHMESYVHAWDLLQTALAAIARKPAPEASLLKALFLFARSEGYPVAGGWLGRLPEPAASEVRRLLQSPVEQLAEDPPADRVRLHIEDLYRFFGRDTDLLAPGG